jgi:hypothetical protein
MIETTASEKQQLGTFYYDQLLQVKRVRLRD